MTDKEVGELWRMLIKPETSNLACEESLNLIRKLVEERAKRCAPNIHGTDGIWEALTSFGIDVSTWPKDDI